MSSVPQTAVTMPLADDSRRQLDAAVTGLDRDQLLWTSGYLAGLAANAEAAAVSVALPSEATSEAPAESRWHVLYATETGNSRRVATELAARAQEAGLAVELADLRDIRPKSLARMDHALFVVATHGVGEAPDGSEPFFEFWFGERAPRLPDLGYSVLALGDSSYADFCAVGAELDARLQALGATRLSPRVDCDVDYEAPAAAWTRSVLERSEALAPATPRSANLHAVPEAPRVSRDRPYAAAVLANQPITGVGSGKSVHHIELDIEDAGMAYAPGDALGVHPENPPPLVEALLDATGLDGAADVRLDETTVPLADALTAHREVTVLSRPLLERLAGEHAALEALLGDREALAAFLRTRQLVDVVNDYPADWTPQALVDALRRLTPRLYSIASSPDANPGEVHLTVDVVRYRAFGREHWGAASNFVVSGRDSVPVYVEPNEHFRLPDDGDLPIIMIGAGTGVAPYRAFVEHRREHGQRGDNWLVFGDRNLRSDFLYQLEWLRYRKEGSLARLDVAFSRDQAQKVYVQHRLLEQAAELRRWLDRGAHIYVCGDADHMAVDVHRALATVLERGGLTAEQAAGELALLKQSGRYQRDVY